MDFQWIGNHKPYLDEVSIEVLHTGLIVGCYGGTSAAGAYKNEDAIFILHDDHSEWTFAVIIDAHKTAESAELLISVFNGIKQELISICSADEAFIRLEPRVIALLMEENIRLTFKKVSGEASCLILFHKGPYIWWLSIGDCMALLLHPELAALGQFELNQRQFFEWVGETNTFDLPVPCYTTGRRQLRTGTNYIVLLTDGVLDTEDEYFHNKAHLYEWMVNGNTMEENLKKLLCELQLKHAQDSASLIGLAFDNDQPGVYPSDLRNRTSRT